jgi:formylglycine-generating enzyme required for sulfatase activity
MTSLYSGVSPTYTADTSDSDYSAETDKLAWNYHNNADDPDCVTNANGFATHIVGKKPANPWGLYDMLGNTGDLCLDWFASVSASSVLQVDPVGAARAMDATHGRVWRGGNSCASAYGSDLRAARNFAMTGNSASFVGFRLACPAVAVGSLVNRGGEQ